jgi:hypothetical protein
MTVTVFDGGLEPMLFRATMLTRYVPLATPEKDAEVAVNGTVANTVPLVLVAVNTNDVGAVPSLGVHDSCTVLPDTTGGFRVGAPGAVSGA